MLTTITELPEYIKRADSLLTDFERRAVTDYLAEHPLAGDVMEGTGGIRKLRWGRGSKGERANLSKADRNALSRLVSILVHTALEVNDD